MKVALFEHQRSGCYWYRTLHPMKCFENAGIGVEKVNLNMDVDIDNICAFQVYGIYPFSFEKVLTYFKEEKKKIVYDLDDALEYIDITNPFYFAVKKDSRSQEQIF